jgi:hypothetical protein
VTDGFADMTNGFARCLDEYAAGKARRLARRRMIRGKGLCACCENPVRGPEFPAAKDCAGFFGGELEEGDGICWVVPRGVVGRARGPAP